MRIPIAQAQTMPPAALADLVLGKSRPKIVAARPALFADPTPGRAQLTDMIEFAEAPRRTAFAELCSLRVITMVFDHRTSKTERVDGLYFRRTPAGAAQACPADHLLPVETSGYFEVRNQTGTDPSPAEVHFAVAALDRAARGAARIDCDDAASPAKFCARKTELLLPDPLPGMNGVDLGRCGVKGAFVCVAIDRTDGRGTFVREELATDASSIDATAFSIPLVKLSSGLASR